MKRLPSVATSKPRVSAGKVKRSRGSPISSFGDVATTAAIISPWGVVQISRPWGLGVYAIFFLTAVILRLPLPGK